MGRRLMTEPAIEPVSLAEAKEQLSISDSVQDAVITRHITAARIYAESYTGRAFITQTWEEVLDHFPSEIELTRQPVQSITQLTYVDTDQATQTLSASNYGLDNTSPRHWVLPAAGTDWPSTYQTPNAVRVQYVAGYGADSTDVPATIRDAILMTVTQLLKNATTELGAPILSVAPAVHQMLNPYRIFRL